MSSPYGTPCLSPRHLLLHVIRPTLSWLAGPDAPTMAATAAEELVLGTMAQESALRALDQVTGARDTVLGPAIGLGQMEPATHDDLWTNFLAFKPALAARVRDLRAAHPSAHVQLATNLAYAAAMVRIHYARVPAPLPPAGAVQAQAAYWKAHYNTPLGKGRAEDYARAWAELVAPNL